MAYVWAIITFLNNIFEAWKAWGAAQAAKRAADALARELALHKAAEAAKQAKTPEDAYADEENIVDNSADKP